MLQKEISLFEDSKIIPTIELSGTAENQHATKKSG
jgi:hypothetical protein